MGWGALLSAPMGPWGKAIRQQPNLPNYRIRTGRALGLEAEGRTAKPPAIPISVVYVLANLPFRANQPVILSNLVSG